MYIRCIAAAQYPHYLAGAGPHDLQAAAAAGAYGSLHNNLPPALNAYPRPPLVSVITYEFCVYYIKTSQNYKDNIVAASLQS